MKIYVLPISGGGFAVQLGLLKVIYEATKDGKKPGIVPDLVLGSSGGQISAYLAMVGNWRDDMILKNAYLIDSSLFVESWTPPFFPTWIAFPLTKSIYRTADGLRDLFNKVYTPASVVTTEIWSGTYNTMTQKAAMFCNLPLEKAKIKDTNDTKYIYDSEKSVYLNGDVDKTAMVCYASASIPYITPGVVIDGNRHIDGGVAYGSPITPLKSKVIDAIKFRTYDPLIQIHHFASYDMNDKFSDSIYSNSIGLLVHSSLLQDRATTLDVLREFGEIYEKPDIYQDVNCKILRSIMLKYSKKSYVMMFSPKKSNSVPVTNFNGNDVIAVIKNIEKDFTVLVWYLK